LSPLSSNCPQLVRLVPFEAVVVWLAYVRATAPVINPAKAAPATNALVDLFIAAPLVVCLVCADGPRPSRQAGADLGVHS
jgi:hypothetical protein